MVSKFATPIDALLVAEIEWEAEQESTRRLEAQRQMQAEELARLRQEQEAQSSEVWKLYRDDPVAWVHDMIDWRDGEGPAEYQDEILAALPVHKRVTARGPHVIGKSATMAWATLWYGLTRDGLDWKVATTASAWRQLTKFLWPEIRKWARRLRWDKIGRQPFDRRTELLMYSLKLRTGEAFAMASDVPENMEGAHADYLLGLFDESKTIPDATFDALEGAFAGPGEVMALAMSTPGPPSGRFFDIHSRKPGFEDWHVITVTMERAIAAGRMSPAWAEQRRMQWGELSAVYQNRVLGNFAQADEDTVIPLAWVEDAIERWREVMEPPADAEPDWKPALPSFTGVGVDVGSGSARSDKTTMALLYGEILAEIRKYQNADTMQTAGRVKGIIDALKGYAVIDMVGIGLGTLNRLQEQNVSAYGFIAGARSERKDRSGELGYADTRSEAWWTTRERLDPAYNPTLALPPDDEMIGDLTAPKSRVMSGGKIRVESKDDLRKPDRLGRSTDVGDAVVQVLWTPHVPPKVNAAPRGIQRTGPSRIGRRD